MRRILRDNGLSIAAFALFAVAIVGHAIAGYRVYASEQREHHQEVAQFASYLSTGDFLESVFENMESEFLQMALFVLLTAFLIQRGSAESKDPSSSSANDEIDALSPWPARRGGIVARVYAHSLSIALLALFAVSFALHAIAGSARWNSELIAHGEAPRSIFAYAASAQFWFESFQNWQSEFLSVGVLVVLSIFLRERGSEQSKPVGAAHGETGPG